MIDTSAYKDLLKSLSRVFASFPASLTEAGSDKGNKADSDIPDPKEKKITIVSVSAPKHEGVKIPKLKGKKDEKNDGVIGSGKKGGKKE